MVVPTVPDWMKFAANNSYVSYMDICNIFGYKRTSISEAIASGRFPKPDAVGADCPLHKGKRQWLVSTIRAEIKRRRELLLK